MINDLYILIPEIFLSLSILTILMLGVFIKKSFNLVFNLSSLIIIITIAIILNNTNNTEKVFLDSFVRDEFSNFFKILILISSLFVLNSSKNFIIDNKLNKFEYPIIVLISILGMFFMVSSNDLILFYLGLELQSLSLYILAAIDRDKLRSSESGIKYFVLSALSSGLLLYGCSLLYGFTGSTNFEVISNELIKQNTGAVFAMVFILVGLAFKISAVPFHMWTPDVYEGSPTSITSYFAAVPKVAGFAVLIKFMYIPFSNILLEWQTIIIFISIASMILGAVAAIGQKNLKRLLAYSSIGHMGYALAGIATGAVSGYKISIIYKDKDEVKILSKMNLNNVPKVNNQRYTNLNLDNEKDFQKIIENLKIIYEDYWKKNNEINTSIKLPITLAINSKKYKKIMQLEETLNTLDLISYFYILKFDNKVVQYRIIYNGSPKNFFNNTNKNDFNFPTENNIWFVK